MWYIGFSMGGLSSRVRLATLGSSPSEILMVKSQEMSSFLLTVSRSFLQNSTFIEQHSG